METNETRLAPSPLPHHLLVLPRSRSDRNLVPFDVIISTVIADEEDYDDTCCNEWNGEGGEEEGEGRSENNKKRKKRKKRMIIMIRSVCAFSRQLRNQIKFLFTTCITFSVRKDLRGNFWASFGTLRWHLLHLSQPWTLHVVIRFREISQNIGSTLVIIAFVALSDHTFESWTLLTRTKKTCICVPYQTF